jgi:hypothetical protein
MMIGLVALVLVTGDLSVLLDGVTATDPLVFTLMPIILAFVAAIAVTSRRDGLQGSIRRLCCRRVEIRFISRPALQTILFGTD